MYSDNKIKVVFIGAGNLATNLAISLYNSDFQILQVYSRTKESAIHLAASVKSESTNNICDIAPNADIYFICIPDKAIHDIVDSLTIDNGVVVHTSGSTSIDVLSGMNSKGYGIFYPFQTFSKNRIIPFNNIPICINADSDKTFIFLSRIASALSSKVIRMNSEALPWLHLAGVFANNFTNHLIAISHQISNVKDFDFELLKPLVEETVKKAFDGNPLENQTGPAVRYDQNTINLHIEKLKEYSPELADIYKALTLSIQNLTKKP